MQNIVDEQQQQQQQADAAMRSQTDQQGTPQATPPAARTPAGSTQQHPSLLLSTPRANLLTATQQALPSPSDMDSPLKELRRVWKQQAQHRGTPPAVADTPRPAQQIQETQASIPSQSR